MPDESTLRKLFACLDADALDTALGVWMFTRTSTVRGRRVIAIDGKSLRGAADKDATMPTRSPAVHSVGRPLSASGARWS